MADKVAETPTPTPTAEVTATPVADPTPTPTATATTADTPATATAEATTTTETPADASTSATASTTETPGTDTASVLSMVGGATASGGVPHDQKIAKADALKDSGNEAFRTGRLKDALLAYNHALMYLHEGTGDTKTNGEELRLRNVNVESNLAACHMRLNNMEKVLFHCDKLLKLDPKNVKGLWRRAKAYAARGSWASATQDLELALSVEPNNPDVKRDYVVSKAHSDEIERQRKKSMSKMFSHDDEDTPKTTATKTPATSATTTTPTTHDSH